MLCDAGTQVNGRGGLANATLLITHRDDRGRAMLVQRLRLREFTFCTAGEAGFFRLKEPVVTHVLAFLHQD